jgi:hypothetical protein
LPKGRFIHDFSDGVDPVYIELLEEAERRSAEAFKTSHQRGERGIVVGPTEGNFNHATKALENAKRIRYILGNDRSVKIALMASKEHVELLTKKCSRNETKKEDRETCRLWANGTLFDDVIETIDDEFVGNDNHTDLGQGTSKHWLKALGGYRNAPYKKTLFLDTDAYPCPGFEKLYGVVTPRSPWQLPNYEVAHLAVGIDQYGFADGSGEFWTPGNKTILKDFLTFRERNTGSVLFHFHDQVANTFAQFLPLVAEHVFNNVGTIQKKVTHDQIPFRVALYLFRRLVPDFVEHQLPMHSSCRSYPGASYAGTDGFEYGMFPIQQKGQHCRECRCTPCLIAHTRIYPVTINGNMGWEEFLEMEPFNLTAYHEAR